VQIFCTSVLAGVEWMMTISADYTGAWQADQSIWRRMRDKEKVCEYTSITSSVCPFNRSGEARRYES